MIDAVHSPRHGLFISVGTAVASGPPPHRSVLQEFPSYGSFLESGATALGGIRMNESGTGEMQACKALHVFPCPDIAVSLAAIADLG